MVGSINASIAGRDCSSLSKSPPESTDSQPPPRRRAWSRGTSGPRRPQGGRPQVSRKSRWSLVAANGRIPRRGWQGEQCRDILYQL